MRAAITIWHKHMTKLRVHPEEAVGLLIQPIMWVVLFGVGMKGLIGQGMGIEEDTYVAFMVPGIIALTALGAAIAGGVVWLSERIQGIVKEYLVAPIARLSILMGNAFSIITKSVFQAVVIFIVGALMGAQVSFNPIGWLGGLVLVAGYGAGFAGIALAGASKSNDIGAYHMLIFLFNLPLLFLSNALYPLESLPGWMEIGARLNPTSYVVDGLRQMVFENGAALAGGETLALWLCFVVVAAFAVLGMGFAYVVFRKTVQ